MQKRPIQRGRPAGATSFEAAPAAAFGAAVRAARTAQGIAQESLAYRAGVERSHMGKIERGEHLPTLALVLKIAAALDCSAAALVAATASSLPQGWFSPTRDASRSGPAPAQRAGVRPASRRAPVPDPAPPR